jgi:scyllo-inositol 2-dehydrogenase (NADP+)
VNVAIVGYGLAGRVFHGPLIAATPGMHVGAVVTANPERRAEAHRDFPDARIVSQAQEIWAARDQFDLVIVATASGSHAAVAGAAIDAGIAVVVEKPIATSRAAAQSLIDHAVAKDVLVVPFLNRRWDADHLTLRDLLAQRRLGTVLRYESRFERWRPNPGSGWRDTRSSDMGGGILLDLGTHLIDQALTLFGSVRHVYAEIFARRGGSDDDVFIALHHESGEISHLWAGALAAAPGPRLRVLGDRGGYVIATLDGQEDALRAGRRPDQPAYADVPPDRWGRLFHGDAGEVVPTIPGRWSDFYLGVRDALRSGAPPPVSTADAIAGLAVIDAARESARRGGLAVPIATNA